MATAKPPGTQRNDTARTGPPRHRWRNTLLVVVLLGALAVALLWAWFRHEITAQALLGTSYGARVACTCRYVEGRGLKDCRKDFEPGMELVTLSDNAAARSVTARVPLIASQTATFRDGAGCQLQSWAP